jgi:hypothetical protein
MRGEQFQKMVDVTADALIDSLPDQMPDGHYRDFYQWGFTQANPVRDLWLQTTGLTQLVKLTVNLYEGLVPDEQIPQLVEYCIPVNIYQIYEIVSDNLGIGLGHRAADDRTFTGRRDVVLEFNEAMVKRLQHSPMRAEQLLQPLKQLMYDISSANQSLSPHKHLVLMRAYLNLKRPPSTKDLEYATWPLLAANIEAAAQMSRFTQPYKLGQIITHGVIQRYQAVSSLIECPEMPLNERLVTSTHAILVMPILAYFISGLCEKVAPVDDFQRVIVDNTLPEAMHLCATLIRLLNDLGTRMIMQPSAARTTFFDDLRHRSRFGGTIDSIVKEAVADHGALLTRIDKDIRHGEFNMAFYDLYDMPSVTDALDTFENRMAYFSNLYTQSRERMYTLLDRISNTLKDERASAIIDRCLKFHEQLYAHSFEEAEGEYAV